MSAAVNLPWGSGELEVRLPQRWRLLGELTPGHADPAGDVADECRKALSTPLGATRLADRNLGDKRILLVVDDHSRPTPVAKFIGPVLDELAAAGVADHRIRILVATGVHRPSRPEEVQAKLGSEVACRFPWQCHDAYHPDGLADLGVTSRGTRIVLNRLLVESDLVICLGAVEPHLLLGFGGGLKMIMPGCAGSETIARNHMQGVDPDHFDYVGVHGTGSPMRLDLEEGARKLGREIFIVNAAMNEMALPVRFFCGDPIEAHRKGELFVERIAGLEVPEQADVVITNSCPMDYDLRQSVKCVGNTLFACKAGGVMLGCVKSEQGLGEIPLAKKTLPYAMTRLLLRVLGKNRVLGLVEKVKKGQPVEELFIGHFGLQMLLRNHLALFSDSTALPEDVGRKMGLARSFTDVQAMISWAAAKVPSEATAWVVPFGGSTYARAAEHQSG